MAKKKSKRSKPQSSSIKNLRKNHPHLIWLLPLFIAICAIVIIMKPSHTQPNVSLTINNTENPPSNHKYCKSYSNSPDQLIAASQIPLCQNLGMELPENTTITQTTQNSYLVSFNNSSYEIELYNPNLHGPCPMGTPSSECGYIDEELPNIKTFRIWHNTDGINMLNPQSIKLNKNSVNHFNIYKTSPNTVFTPQEVESWRQILSTIFVIQN